MNTLRTDKMMKNRVHAILIGMVFGLATVGVSRAMSDLVSLSIEPEWPATSEPGTLITYKITAVTRAGAGLMEVSLSSLGLPEGAVVVFSPKLLRFTGHEPTTQTASMTVTCPEVMPTDTYPFTVTGTAQREALSLTNQVLQALYSIISGPPVLALDQLSDGGLRLRGKGATGQDYQIETTPSLTNPDWTPVGATTADGNGRFTFFAAPAKAAPVRFYRAVASGLTNTGTP